jgi:uncharacterized protein (DUF2252 family)
VDNGSAREGKPAGAIVTSARLAAHRIAVSSIAAGGGNFDHERMPGRLDSRVGGRRSWAIAGKAWAGGILTGRVEVDMASKQPGADRATAGATVARSQPPSTGTGRRRPPARAAVEHLTRQERSARGKAARAEVPRASHAEWTPSAQRTSPIDLLEEQARTRVRELVPIRHGRMLVSPFSYFRGAALPMASDLATTPRSGFPVQLCGDAHLSNFGMFGSPERHLFFDVNDFDETTPGPWEWDVKRLAASLEIAGRDNELDEAERKRIVRLAVRSYRQTMRELARQPMLQVWYAHLEMSELLPRFRSLLDPKKTPSVWRAIDKARAHDSHQAFEKLCHTPGDEPRIVSDPPLILPIEELVGEVDREIMLEAMGAFLRSYHRTLPPDRRQLIDRYRLVHMARKVVGVGSVGTEAWILLLLDEVGSPLLLQVKEADISVLERFTSKSKFSNQGARVVAGQHLMQTASDILLGWDRFDFSGSRRDYYIRQLRDWKGSADVAGMTPAGMELWGQMCGWTLARGHARSGDRIAIASYLGKSEEFDRAIVDFAIAYADQNELDHRMLADAVAAGRLPAKTGI